MTKQINFIAELVYEKFPGWRFIEPHIIAASHPEIAYKLAIAMGNKGRGDKRFAGLAELTVQNEYSPVFGHLEKGEASDLVVEKEKLSAFHDSRWAQSEREPE